MGAVVCGRVFWEEGDVETGSVDVPARNPSAAGGWHGAHPAMGTGDTPKTTAESSPITSCPSRALLVTACC